MYTLIFDTTAQACSICLLENDKIIDSFSQNLDFGQSEVLLPAIQKILQNNSIAFQSISNIFVCIGPGSFTGVRASIAAAKIFGVVCPQINISGFSAFDAYISLLEAKEISPCNAVILETRRDDFYVRFYDNKANPLGEASALSRDEIIAYLKKQGTLITLIGDGVERFLNKPSGLTLHSIKIYDSLPLEAMQKEVVMQQKNKKFNFPKPLYIRPADVTVPK